MVVYETRFQDYMPLFGGSVEARISSRRGGRSNSQTFALDSQVIAPKMAIIVRKSSVRKERLFCGLGGDADDD